MIISIIYPSAVGVQGVQTKYNTKKHGGPKDGCSPMEWLWLRRETGMMGDCYWNDYVGRLEWQQIESWPQGNGVTRKINHQWNNAYMVTSRVTVQRSPIIATACSWGLICELLYTHSYCVDSKLSQYWILPSLNGSLKLVLLLYMKPYYTVRGILCKPWWKPV